MVNSFRTAVYVLAINIIAFMGVARCNLVD